MSRIKALFPAGLLVIAGLVGQEIQGPGPGSPPLAAILAAARDYGAKLERAALDFVCLEEVEESLDLRRGERADLERAAQSKGKDPQAWVASPRDRLIAPRNPKLNNTYLFDYQFIRRDKKVEENRVLLKRNGRKVGPQTSAPRFSAFNYADVLMMPVRLLDEKSQDFYSYRLQGGGHVSGLDAWVLEVVPRMTGITRYLGGRIWLKQDDSSVLRIEWDPATFDHYEDIIARAASFKAEPEVRSVTEFGFEKNGIRFPSSDLTEEAYRDADGKLFVRARTEVTYRDYKFFMVETSSTLK
jgi:hypothetical protein